ncbi:lipase secretion chaperone [Pseudomonas saliphila]|uniref:lipase secretion chaperone n=1 Tax=Pseudomonas saliphila TaxID=2586906 RepID=UPI0015B40496|nr:lipase secretion chaperone [Pseudomonas saliphila]
MSNRIILTLTAASAVALVVAVGSWNQAETETERTFAPIGAPSTDDPPSADKPATRASDALPGAALLKGVDVIDGITLHPDGELQYSLQLRHLFDHFLGMAGAPERIAAAREALNQHLRSAAINPGSQEEALHAFDLYVEYLREAEQVELNSYEAGDLQRTFDVLFSLRRSVLGTPLAEAFFSDKEAREQIIVEQQRIAADQHLSEAERERLYGELEDRLPPHLQEIRRQATAMTRLSQDTAALRSAGATEAAIQQMREQQVGYEAAQRLSELDKARAEWASRVEAYQRERDAVLAAGTLPLEEHEAVLRELREQFFTEREMRRIAALDRTAATD